MEKHQFKILYSKRDDVYRIYDLTDSTLVGITEMLENDDYLDKQTRIQYIKDIKENKGLRARIVGYGIFVQFDDYNTKWVPTPKGGRQYLLSVLRQMAECFKQEIIEMEPEEFDIYRIPQPKKRIITAADKGATSTQRIVEVPSSKNEQEKKEELPLAIRIILLLAGIALAVVLIIHVWQIGLFLLIGLAFIPELLNKKR